MLLAKSITPKIINNLGVNRIILLLLISLLNLPAVSQDNSPYSRYGLGDITPPVNITSRGMGGIAAGFSEYFSLNYANPASFGNLQALKELTTNKLTYGRAILDVGINLERRTLSEPDNVSKFTASNALFSHIQVGMPLKKNWGLSFGLRPLSRISYNMFTRTELINGNTGDPIDSALTQYVGTGGSYFANIGTGIKFDLNDKNSLSIGFNGGYLFGKKDYSTKVTLFDENVSYNSGKFQDVTSLGDLFFQGGLQYSTRMKDKYILTLGSFGNWNQEINTKRDIIRETFEYSENSGDVRQDSAYESLNNKGSIMYPSQVTTGFILEKMFTVQNGGWLIGIDYNTQAWDKYQVNGIADPNLRNKWELRVGGQIRPAPKSKSYFSNVAYRAGVFMGPDYLQAGGDVKQVGISLGLGLPIANYNMLSPRAVNLLNLSFEFIKRGNNDNLLKDNLFRLSVGFSFSDTWFGKVKYD